MKSASSKTASGNSVAKEKSFAQKNASPSVNSRNYSKFPKVSSNPTKERDNSSKPVTCSKIPTRLQSKSTVQPRNNFDRKMDDKRKNSKLTPKNKTINSFNSRESFQENKMNSHLFQKEPGALKKASLTRNNQSKNISRLIPKAASSSKERTDEKREEAKRTVSPKKTLPNKSILKRISKSDLDLNIRRSSEEKEIMNRNVRKVSVARFFPTAKRVTFKYSSASDDDEHLRNELFAKNRNESDFYGHSFPLKDNMNSLQAFGSPLKTYMQANRMMSNFIFDRRFAEDADSVNVACKSPVVSICNDGIKLTKNELTLLSPGICKEKESRVIAYSEDSNDSDKGSLQDSYFPAVNLQRQNGLELLDKHLTDLEKPIEEGVELSMETCKSERREIYEDYVPERKQNMDPIPEQPSELNQNSISKHRHDKMIFSDTIAQLLTSQNRRNNCPLNELSRKTLIEKSVEEKVRILKNQFLNQMKEVDTKYYLFQKKVEEPIDTSSDFENLELADSMKDNRRTKDNEFQPNTAQDDQSRTSNKEHFHEIKEVDPELSKLLLDYYDQHIRSPRNYSLVSQLEQDSVTSTSNTPSPQMVKSVEDHENANNYCLMLGEIYTGYKDTASNSSVINKSLARKDLNNGNFNKLDDGVRKFQDFFGKALIEEDKLVDILKTYYLEVEGNSSSKCERSNKDAEMTKENQTHSNKKINKNDSFFLKAAKFAMLPFFVFTSVLYFVDFKLNTEMTKL